MSVQMVQYKNHYTLQGSATLLKCFKPRPHRVNCTCNDVTNGLLHTSLI